MDVLLALGIGITLSAACGFRIFVPPLVMSLGAIYGDVQLGESFAWLGTYPALMGLAAATVVEVLAYYIPVVDNLLDSIEIPTAIAVGTLLMSASIGGLTDIEPLLKWAIAIVVGGGTAGIVESFTVMTRAASTTMTGGAANPVMSTMEVLSAGVLSLLGILVPFIAVIVVFGVLAIAIKQLSKLFRQKSPPQNSQS